MEKFPFYDSVQAYSLDFHFNLLENLIKNT